MSGITPVAMPKGEVQVFAASGTYNKPSGLRWVRVTVIGGGGGGSGRGGAYNSGAGGSEGGKSVKWISVDDLAAAETVTIGSGGTGGADASPGSAGGASSFGSHCSATGGDGGGNVTPFDSRYPTQPGEGVGGDINERGQPGEVGTYSGGSPGGNGGGTGGGIGGSANTPVADGGAPGSGGGGGGASANLAGGDGADGVVIVEEFF